MCCVSANYRVGGFRGLNCDVASCAVVQGHQDHGDISHHIKTLSPWVRDDDEFGSGCVMR